MPLWQKFYAENPLATVPVTHLDLQGWGSDSPVFAHVLGSVQPKLIIEVGTWKGASAVHMAKLAPEAEILCIDTWLGSAEMWDYPDLKRQHGYPQFYYTFASNVVHYVGRERICPMALPSSVAATVLKRRGILADVIYIDGSHEYADVKRDIEDYWPLVRPGGILFGDDYGHPEVYQAVQDTLHDVRAMWEKFIVVKN